MKAITGIAALTLELVEEEARVVSESERGPRVFLRHSLANGGSVRDDVLGDADDSSAPHAAPLRRRPPRALGDARDVQRGDDEL